MEKKKEKRKKNGGTLIIRNKSNKNVGHVPRIHLINDKKIKKESFI